MAIKPTQPLLAKGRSRGTPARSPLRKRAHGGGWQKRAIVSTWLGRAIACSPERKLRARMLWQDATL